jgi:signal transduction histidine kinase
LREAEEALKSMQTQLTGALRQKERLAQLGGAVAKISHDLRNILASAQLFADRMEGSADPVVARAAPKLVNSISRAINLCETTLAFGKAEEPPPRLSPLALRPWSKRCWRPKPWPPAARSALWLTCRRG